MPKVRDPFRFLLIAVAGWINHHQLQMIEYLLRRTVCCASYWPLDYPSSVAVADHAPRARLWLHQYRRRHRSPTARSGQAILRVTF